MINKTGAINNTQITELIYDRNQCQENKNIKLTDTLQKADGNMIHWINVNSLDDSEAIEFIGKGLNIHHLIIEDIFNINQMVKLDEYDGCLFMVMKLIDFNTKDSTISTEHVCVLLKGNYLVTFTESNTNVFDRVKEMIIDGKRNIRKFGADYLCYELIDTVVDSYFTVVDHLGDTTDDIENELMTNSTKSTLDRIYFIKKELVYLRKSVYPLRELIGGFTRLGSDIISEGTVVYLRDVYDHLIQIVDTIEIYQDIMSNMMDTYLSSINNNTNDIMKVLTVFSAVFIPLTFLTGVYGMNLKNIPEANLNYSYYLFWLVCIIITFFMIRYFRRKKWM